MSDIPKVIDIDCNTNVAVERDATPEEIANMEAVQAEAAVRQAEAEAQAAKIAEDKASAEAKLTALGLTADEIAALKA